MCNCVFFIVLLLQIPHTHRFILLYPIFALNLHTGNCRDAQGPAPRTGAAEGAGTRAHSAAGVRTGARVCRAREQAEGVRHQAHGVIKQHIQAFQSR